MPAVSVSSQLSQAVYVVAVFGLALMLSRPVALVYSGSQERAAEVAAAGLSSMIDSMSPGMTVVAGLEAFPGVASGASLSGETVVVHFGSSTATARVVWDLARATLVPGREYSFALEGGEVAVGPASHG
ncbi:MAG: hypothetical protein JRN23_03250 [Nitrososphaerota archaeon]|nr:hypothetical protein [Nitrososphaerota archaeon]MDG7022284.1 hypothetical protein [Nitrososphaerota archaeon]